MSADQPREGTVAEPEAVDVPFLVIRRKGLANCVDCGYRLYGHGYGDRVVLRIKPQDELLRFDFVHQDCNRGLMDYLHTESIDRTTRTSTWACRLCDVHGTYNWRHDPLIRDGLAHMQAVHWVKATDKPDKEEE